MLLSAAQHRLARLALGRYALIGRSAHHPRHQRASRRDVTENACMLRRKVEPNWRVMKRLEDSLLREFESQGVRHVEFVIAFSEPFTFWVWLGSATDAEREQLQADASVNERIRAEAASLSIDALYEGWTIGSQETVDRDYQGSWFYRLR
jgi:hypothetical protein